MTLFQPEEENDLRSIMSGLLALAWLAVLVPMSAHAGSGTSVYKPGAIKAAVAKGQTVLLHYKSTW